MNNEGFGSAPGSFARRSRREASSAWSNRPTSTGSIVSGSTTVSCMDIPGRSTTISQKVSPSPPMGSSTPPPNSPVITASPWIPRAIRACSGSLPPLSCMPCRVTRIRPWLGRPTDRRRRIAHAIDASGPFMSAAPRPTRMSPRRSGGACPTSIASRWPCHWIVGPSPDPSSAMTLGLAGNSRSSRTDAPASDSSDAIRSAISASWPGGLHRRSRSRVRSAMGSGSRRRQAASRSARLKRGLGAANGPGPGSGVRIRQDPRASSGPPARAAGRAPPRPQDRRPGMPPRGPCGTPRRS
jgi:hypothetical protein